MELKALERDVWACLQPDRGFGWSNSGLVGCGGGLVVDTFWDLPHTQRMKDLYAGVFPDRPRRVVNTHHNGDHCWGNQLFSDAEIIAHRLCKERFDGDGSPAMLQALKGARDGEDPGLAWFANELEEWDFSGITLTPPTTTFEETLDLDLDGLIVRLIHVGPAHTPGDLVAHLPERGIVFAGDVLFRLCTPIAWEGTFDAWIGALDAIADLKPQIVVPGHGPLCGVEGLEELSAYFRYVKGESTRLHAAGVPVAEAAQRIELGPYADWTEPERLVFNVARAYREIEGEPYDAPIDAVSLIRRMHDLRTAWAT